MGRYHILYMLPELPQRSVPATDHTVKKSPQSVLNFSPFWDGAWASPCQHFVGVNTSSDYPHAVAAALRRNVILREILLRPAKITDGVALVENESLYLETLRLPADAGSERRHITCIDSHQIRNVALL